MSKTYMYVLAVIAVYLIIIFPSTIKKSGSNSTETDTGNNDLPAGVTKGDKILGDIGSNYTA